MKKFKVTKLVLGDTVVLPEREVVAHLHDIVDQLFKMQNEHDSGLVQKAFKMFDKDGSNTIDKLELSDVICEIT